MRLASSEMRKPAVCGMRRIPVASGVEPPARPIRFRTRDDEHVLPIGAAHRDAALHQRHINQAGARRIAQRHGDLIGGRLLLLWAAVGTDLDEVVASAADAQATDNKPIRTIGAW